jgi:outer membrane receptor for ferrienterochelin and colicin
MLNFSQVTRTPSTIAIVFFTTTIYANPLGEQSPSIYDLSLEELLKIKVVTVSSIPEHISEAPGSITVITRNQIRRRGYRNLTDILKDLPSYDVQNYNDCCFYNRITARGFTGGTV